MSAVYTLEQILNAQKGISADGRAFCEALLTYGEVLAVRLSYLPEGLLWLVSSPMQSRLMHAHRPDTWFLSLAEARDLFTTLGDPCPDTLMEVAGRFATAAPGPQQWTPGPDQWTDDEGVEGS
jgi:hypothetical protein